MSTPHRIEELIVDLSFERETDGDTPVDEELLRGLVLDRLLPALDQALSLHAEDGIVTQIDSLEIDLGEIPEQELESELPLRVQEQVRRALADLLRNPVQSTDPSGVRTISRAAADTDVLKRYLTNGRFAARVEPGGLAPHEMALDRLLDGATGELLSFLRQAQMRPAFARRLAQQFPERQLHALLRALMPVSAADELSKLIARFEQLLSGSETDGVARRNMQRWLWQYILNLALRDSEATSGPVLIGAGTQMPVPAGLRSAAAQLKSELKSDAQHPVAGMAAQLLDQLSLHARAVQAVPGHATVDAMDHATLAGTDNEAIVHALTHALLQADIAEFAPSTKWRQLLQARSALWSEAMLRIGANTEIWQRIAATFPEPILDEMTALLAPEAASALRPMMTNPAWRKTARGSTEWDAPQLWAASMMYLLQAKTASFDADRYTDVLLNKMAGGDRILRRASASDWLALISIHGNADGPAASIARALSTRLASTAAPASVAGVNHHIDADVASVALPNDEPQRRLDPGSVSDSTFERDSDVVKALDLPVDQRAACLQQWLSQMRKSGRSVATHQWSVDALQRLINAVAALDGSGRHATMLQAIALHAPRARDQQRYFSTVLEKLVHGALLDLDDIISNCNAAGERGMHVKDELFINRDNLASAPAAMPALRTASLGPAIIEALVVGDTALEALYREKVAHRHAGQTAGFTGTASILYQLIAALADEQSSASGNMLLDAIATRARRSSDAVDYLRHALDDLAHERAVDLDMIDARIMHDRLPSSPEQMRQEPDRAAGEIVERVATALASANPAGLYPDWTYWRRTQRPALRHASQRIGARIDVWRRIASAFPAALLDDMTALLAPDAVPVLRKLMNSDAMFESAGGIAQQGSMQQWAQQLWTISAINLLDLKQAQFDTADYVTALLIAIVDSDQERYRTLALAWKEMRVAEPAAGMQAAATVSALSVAAKTTSVQEVPSATHMKDAQVPVATVEQSSSELAKVLDLPPDQQADWLKQWQSQVRTGRLEVDSSRLTIEQLQQLINAVGALDGADRRATMLQAIALHALRAHDRQHYFAAVLEQLARGALLDLEDIIANCNKAGHGRQLPSTEEDISGAAALVLPRTNGREVEPDQIDDTARGTDVRERAAKAFLNANPAGLYPDWDVLRRANMPALRQALHQVGARADVWQKVAANFPASLLEELTALLAPEAASALGPLLARSASPQSMQQLWVVSIMYLLNAPTNFNAGRYANVLLDQLAGQDQIRRRASAAAWQEAMSAQEETGATSDAVAQILAEQLALPQPTRPAAPTDCSIDAGAAPEDGLHKVRTAIADALARSDHAALESVLHRLPPAGPSTELPGMTDGAVVSHRLINSFVTEAAGGANRAPLLQAIAAHASRSVDPQRFFLHVLADLVHERAIDLDEIEQRCTVAESVTAHSATQRTIGETPSAASVHASHRPVPLRHGSWLAQLLAAHPPAARAALSPMLHEAGTATSVEQLPRTLLRRVVSLLSGPHESAMLRHASDVGDIFAQCHPAVARDRIDELKWHFLFSWLFEQRRPFEPSLFSHRMVDHLTGCTGVAPMPAITDLLRRRLGVEPPPQEKLPALIKAAATYLMPEAPADKVEEIYIGNAGQVLAAPYMPRLFSMLNLTEAGRFKSDEAAERAVHLLQFMVSGQSDCPEYQLGLNKILCGVKASQPIVREIEIESHEREVTEALIKAMIEHWKIIGNTSVDGLRVSFLQRTGSLHLKDDAWYLTVQGSSIDMLLDRLPWSFSIIKHPWMERAVHVNWR